MNSFRPLAKSASAALLLGLLCTALQAQVNYGDYTFITRDDLAVTNHINSGSIVGGDFIVTGSNTSVGQTKKDQQGYGLMVYGNMTGSGSMVAMHNSKYYLANQTAVGGNVGSIFLQNPGAGSTGAADPLGTIAYGSSSFGEVWGKLTSISNTFANTATSATVTTNFTDMNSLKFNVAANPNAGVRQNFITFDLTQGLPTFGNPGNLQPLITATGTGSSTVYNTQGSKFDFLGTSSNNKLIINVIGASGSTFNFNTNTAASGQSNVLWNFIGIDSVHLLQSDQFSGSVLATGANVHFTGSKNLMGQVFANGYYGNGGGEYHGEYNFFTGDLPPIPEPSTYALMGAGLCGALAFWRRRRAKAA